MALGKDVARIDGVEVAGIAVQATAAASRRPVPGVVPTGIIEERHGSPRPLLEVAPEVIVQAGRAAKLAIDVRQLAAGIAQE